MRQLRRVIPGVGVAGLLSACASGGARSRAAPSPPAPDAAARAAVSGPRIIAPGSDAFSPLLLPYQAQIGAGLRVEVVIGPDARPDLQTLKLAGPGAELARDRIAAWLSASAFEPAHQVGGPTAAVLTLRIGSV